jgi:hypothetical protein
VGLHRLVCAKNDHTIRDPGWDSDRPGEAPSEASTLVSIPSIGTVPGVPASRTVANGRRRNEPGLSEKRLHEQKQQTERSGESRSMQPERAMLQTARILQGRFRKSPTALVASRVMNEP